MKKVLIGLVAAVALAVFAQAQTHVFTNALGQTITVNLGEGVTLGSAVVPGAVANAPTYPGTPLPITATTTATNGQAVTVIPGYINMLQGVGQANALTNTITLANFPAAGLLVPTYIANATGSTNLVAIAQTGNFKGPAIVIPAGRLVRVVATAADAIYGE